MARIIYLTENEEKALRLLAQGQSAHALREQCLIPLAGMAIFTQDIRRKTGIRDHKHPRECRDYIARYEATIASAAPSEDDLRLMQYFARGETIMGMAYQFKLTEPEVLTELDKAYAKIGIFTRDERSRRIGLRTYLTVFHTQNVDVSPFQMSILRLMAEGKHILEICDTLKEPEAWVKFKLKETCVRLGLAAKGRDVQRNLIRAYLASRDAQKPPQSDPDQADSIDLSEY